MRIFSVAHWRLIISLAFTELIFQTYTKVVYTGLHSAQRSLDMLCINKKRFHWLCCNWRLGWWGGLTNNPSHDAVRKSILESYTIPKPWCGIFIT